MSVIIRFHHHRHQSRFIARNRSARMLRIHKISFWFNQIWWLWPRSNRKSLIFRWRAPRLLFFHSLNQCSSMKLVEPKSTLKEQINWWNRMKRRRMEEKSYIRAEELLGYHIRQIAYLKCYLFLIEEKGVTIGLYTNDLTKVNQRINHN